MNTSKKLTLTQSEDLKIGQRGVYVAGPKLTARCEKLGITLWVEKRRKTPSEYERNLQTFIDLPFNYELVYGFTFEGKDYEAGDMPRDYAVIRGIEIGLEARK